MCTRACVCVHLCKSAGVPSPTHNTSTCGSVAVTQRLGRAARRPGLWGSESEKVVLTPPASRGHRPMKQALGDSPQGGWRRTRKPGRGGQRDCPATRSRASSSVVSLATEVLTEQAFA